MDRRTAIYRFCNYQERSHQEVKDKLYALGSYPEEVDQLLVQLIQDNLLNEERFATSFARGHFRMKNWGRIKITQGLKQHRISEYLIRKALKEINPNDYFACALKLGERKWELLAGEKEFIRKGKLYRYLLQKGYESQIITEVIAAIITAA